MTIWIYGKNPLEYDTPELRQQVHDSDSIACETGVLWRRFEAGGGPCAICRDAVLPRKVKRVVQGENFS